MAHIAKYKGSQLAGMLGHYERAAERRGFERDNIDNDRIRLNYNLGPKRHWRDVDFIDARIGELELMRKPRADAVMMCDCVVTLPKSLDPSRAREFFESVYVFLADRYGAENVVSAWVHMDETTPHEHFAWVPVTADGRLSAKDVVSRADLKTLHKDMQEFVEAALGCKVEILLDDERKEEKAARYVDLPEFKAARAATDKALKERDEAEKVAARARASRDASLEDLEILDGALSQARSDLRETTAAVVAAEEREKTVKTALEGAEGRLEAVTKETEEATARLEHLRCREEAAEKENRILADALDRGCSEIEPVAGIVEASDRAVKDSGICYEECISARRDGFKGKGVPSAAELRSRAAWAEAQRAGFEDRCSSIKQRVEQLHQAVEFVLGKLQEVETLAVVRRLSFESFREIARASARGDGSPEPAISITVPLVTRSHQAPTQSHEH